jgi:hypothetical protein
MEDELMPYIIGAGVLGLATIGKFVREAGPGIHKRDRR